MSRIAGRFLLFLLAVGSLVAAPDAGAQQQPGKVWRIGYLAGSPRVPQIDSFLQGLKELGYVDGQNAVIELKLANGKVELLPQLATELVQWKPDVIVAAANVGGLAAKKATSTIPIVVVASHDGVKVGLFESLAHPGGNATGIESLAPDLDLKRLEYLKEALPKVSRIAVLYNSTDPGAAGHVQVTRSTAQSLGFQIRLVEVRSAADFDTAFAEIVRQQPDALLVVTDPMVFANREKIVQFTVQQKLPAIFEYKAFADMGGMMSYGASMAEQWRRAAYYADKILKGAKPADMPVELPTKVEFVINRKTAGAFGISIPQALLVRADEVIQ
jgi:putative ABC transport system substrate-binding protein